MHAWKSKLLALGVSAAFAAAVNAQTSSRTTEPKSDPERSSQPDTSSAASSNPSGSGSSMTSGQSGARNPSSGAAATSPPPGSPMTGAHSGVGDTPGPSGQMANSPASKAEQDFLAKLAHDNEEEIEMAKLAKQNASSPRVKTYADQLLRDHQSAAEQVKACAKGKNIDLTSARADMSKMKDEHKAAMGKLKSLKGSDFDREFVRQMIADHEKTIKEVTAARTRFNDPELVRLLDTLLPTLKQHLATAKDLDKGGSKARSAPRVR
jgi:putative membrane protein